MLKLYVNAKLKAEEIKKDIEGASLIEYSLLIGLIMLNVPLIYGGKARLSYNYM